MSRAQEVLRCNVCENATVSIFCRSCKLDFCKDCIGNHVSESNSEHDVVPYESKFANEVIAPDCEIHENKLCTIVCKECCSPICSVCFMENHRGHFVQDFEEFVRQKQSEIRNDISKIGEFLAHFQGIGSDSEDKIENMNTNCNVLASQIESEGLCLQIRLECSIKCLREDINLYKTNCTELLKSFENKVKNRLELLIEKKREKENVLQNGDGIQIVQYKSDSYLAAIPPRLDCGQVKFESVKSEENPLKRKLMGDIQRSVVGDNIVLKAEKDFQGYGKGNLCFEKGDLFLVDLKTFYREDGDHIMGISLIDGRFGFIPKSHVTVRRLQRPCYQLQSWWMPVGKEEVEIIFSDILIPYGSFCMSEYTDSSYNLSIKSETGVENICITKGEACVSIQNSDTFPSLEDLIHYFQVKRMDSPFYLSSPLDQQIPTASFCGLQIDRENIHIMSEVPLERLTYFDMFEGKIHANYGVSVRIYKLPELRGDTKQRTICANDVVSEGEFLLKCSHENILQFVAMSNISFPVVMITEFVKETLFKYLMTEMHWKDISLQRIVNFATQISNGMEYFHRKKHIHGNLRAENIFVDQNLVLKIAGIHFGKTVEMDPFRNAHSERISAHWASPETLLSETFTLKSDVWSFGVLLYEMITFGKLPFMGKTEEEICNIHEIQINFPRPRECVLDCPDSYFDIIESCCSYKPDDRPNFEVLMDLLQSYFAGHKTKGRILCKSNWHALHQLQAYWLPEGKENASRLLKGKTVEPGTFLISEDKEGVCFTLSVKTEDYLKTPTVKHITIFQLDGLKVCINKHKIYPTLNELIEYHKHIKGEIQCLLRNPWRDSTNLNITCMYTGEELDRDFVKSMKLHHTGHLTYMFSGDSRDGKNVCIFRYKKHSVIKKWTENTFIGVANLQQTFSHNHILKMVGCCSKSNPNFMVTEPVKWVLSEILQIDSGQSLEFDQLIKFALEIASGMKYLSSKGYVHRDLRAINIYLTQEFEVKIGGFHFARKNTTDKLENEEICIRWSAPEVFGGSFVLKSDVWSFGVLLYELITFGKMPYPELSTQETPQKVTSGYRMPKPLKGPLECPEEYYNIIQKCWRTIPDERPNFETLTNIFLNYFK